MSGMVPEHNWDLAKLNREFAGSEGLRFNTIEEVEIEAEKEGHHLEIDQDSKTIRAELVENPRAISEVERATYAKRLDQFKLALQKFSEEQGYKLEIETF